MSEGFITEERLRQMRTDAGDDRLLSTIEGMNRMTAIDEVQDATSEQASTIRVNVEPAISAELKSMAKDLRQFYTSISQLMNALVPSVRAILDAMGRFSDQHGDLIKVLSEWEPVEAREGQEPVTMHHVPSGETVPIEEARRRVEAEMAKRRQAAGRDHKVYETEAEPPCGRDDCEGPGHPACKDCCTGACTEGPEAEADDETSEEDDTDEGTIQPSAVDLAAHDRNGESVEG